MDAELVRSFEDNAEIIVRTLHGQVPRWAGGAFVDRVSIDPPKPPTLTEEHKCWFEDATFEAVGHTGISTCSIRAGAATFKVWRRPSRAEIRRFCAPTYPRMLTMSTSHNEITGPEPCHALAALVRGNYYIVSVILGNRPPMRFPINEKHSFGFESGGQFVPFNPESIQATLALFRRYEWTVAMSVDGAPKLRFVCTPGSAREAFRLRDLPTGKSRRDALIHWVAEHYRNPQIHVNEHLRGKHVFSWRGIDCEIVPSAFDREKEITRKATRTTVHAPRDSRSASRSP